MAKNYQVLLENYEDALMRLLIYPVTQEEGQRLLEEVEELNRSGFEVPKALDDRCLKLIRDAGLQPSQGAGAGEGSPSHFRWRRFGEIVAAAILAAGLLFCVAYAANEQFRVNVLNFCLEMRENGTQFFFRSDGTGAFEAGRSQVSGTEEDFPFEFTYVPEGYEMFKKEKNDYCGHGFSYYCGYAHTEEYAHEFDFHIGTISDGTGLFVDTEDAKITDVKIRGNDGWLIKKIDPYSGEEQIMYLWFDLNNHFSYLFSTLGISQKEFQNIFDNIVIDERLLRSA